jgi:hypothetical protein
MDNADLRTDSSQEGLACDHVFNVGPHWTVDMDGLDGKPDLRQLTIHV